jgi:hypothetical protein
MQFLVNARFNPTLVDLSHSRPRFPPVNTSPEADIGAAWNVDDRDRPRADIRLVGGQWPAMAWNIAYCFNSALKRRELWSAIGADRHQ